VTDNSNAPERIFAWEEYHNGVPQGAGGWIDVNTGGRTEYVRADLFDAMAQQLADARTERDAAVVGAVKVKPLVWENFDAWTYWATCAIGVYRVQERNGTWNATLHRKDDADLIYEYTTDGLTPNDFEAAQLAAQADYEARILAAIQPDPEAHQAALPEAQALFAAAYEAAAVAFDGDSNLDRRICCDGQDCGCMGATAADYVAYQLRALTPAEAKTAQARRDAQMMAQGMREAAALAKAQTPSEDCDDDTDNGWRWACKHIEEDILARAAEVEKEGGAG